MRAVPTFTPNQLGINIHYRNFTWYGLDEKKTLKELLSLPFEHVRIPIPFNEVNPQKGVWDFSLRDQIIEQALKHHKTIHLQLGIKTIGYPEFNIPQWFCDVFPVLLKPKTYVQPDIFLQGYIEEYLNRCAQHFLPMKEIASIHIENEAFSKRLPVSNFRSLSADLTKQEVNVVKSHDPHHRPIVQNFPIDTPEAAWHAYNQSDIVGLNIYNQYFEHEFFKTMYWPAINTILGTLKMLKKRTWVTEFQIAPWIDSHKNPAYPFSEEKVFEGLQKLKTWNPEIIFLWDVEQVLWKAQQHNNQQNIQLLYKFIQ